jgi:hypothetical protein
MSDRPVGVTVWHSGRSVLSISLLRITRMAANFDIYLAYQRNVQNVSIEYFLVFVHE